MGASRGDPDPSHARKDGFDRPRRSRDSADVDMTAQALFEGDAPVEGDPPW